MTVTGRTLGENLDRWTHAHGKLSPSQDVIRPLSSPIKSSGHIRILRGNLAPGGAVAKITGKEGLTFTGKARAFDTEDAFVKAVEEGTFKKGDRRWLPVPLPRPRSAVSSLASPPPVQHIQRMLVPSFLRFRPFLTTFNSYNFYTSRTHCDRI